MKKILLFCCLFFVSLSVNAQNYSYTGTDADIKSYVNNSIENGANCYTKNNTDFIILSGDDTRLTSVVPERSIWDSLDPYTMVVDDKKYILIKENGDGKWDDKDILGIKDSRTNLFASLKSLNYDSDKNKLISKELKAKKVRFALINKDGSINFKNTATDFNIDKIDYIDIKNLKTIANSKDTGVFGHFNIYLKTTDPKKRLIIGHVTFDTEENIEELVK